MLLPALQQLFIAALLGACVYALLRGDGPEIQGAILNLGACIATYVFQVLRGVRWETFDLMVFGVDLAVAAIFFIIAVRSTRFWPIWCFAFALDDLFVQVGRLLGPKVSSLVYGSMSATIWAYLALFALVLGTHRASQARRREARAISPPEQDRTVGGLGARNLMGWRERPSR